MGKKITVLIEYMIRHLHLNNMCVSLVDKLVADRPNKIDADNPVYLEKAYYPQKMVCHHTPNKNIRYDLQIIIPAYNDEKYIRDCLMSVASQITEFSYIVTVVDDGSTDHTNAMVAEMVQRFPNIQLITIEHSGAAEARNAALKEIQAEYVMFVDGDDMLMPNAIETLMKCAYQNNMDVVEGSYEAFSKIRKKVFTHKAEVLQAPAPELWGFSCVKVIKSTFFEDLCFPSGFWYEDTIIFYLLYTRCKRIQTVEEVVYQYRNNHKGMSRLRGSDDKFMDAFWVLYYTLQEMQECKIEMTQVIYEKLLQSIVIAGKRMLCMDKKINKEVLAVWNSILLEKCGRFSTENHKMKYIEKAIRDNDWRKYHLLLICLL